MALVSPGVQVSIVDQSQYLPAATNSTPLVILATAANKADPTGTGVAPGTTAANAGQLYLITSQRDLVQTYGTPFFYTTSNGVPIQGYELNEYGLLTAYSALGVTNSCYCLRADIDLASLVGQTGRPSGNPADGTYWLNTTTTTWGINQFNAPTGSFETFTPIVIDDSALLSGGVPLNSIGSIGQYAVNSIPNYNDPDLTNSQTYFYKTSNNVWVPVGSLAWLQAWPTVKGTNSNPTLTAGDTLTINISGGCSVSVTVEASPNNVVAILASQINALGLTYLSANVVGGKLQIFSSQIGGDTTVNPKYITISGSGTILNDLGLSPGNFFQPQFFYGSSAQQPLWQSSQQFPAPSGSLWIKVGSTGQGLNPVVSEWSSSSATWKTKTVDLATSDWDAILDLDPTGGSLIPAGTVYAQYNFNNTPVATYPALQSPIYYWERVATGPTIATGTVTNFDWTSGAEYIYVQVSIPGTNALTSVYTVSIPSTCDATGFVTAWSAAGIPFTSATVATSGAITIEHTLGGAIVMNDVNLSSGLSTGVLAAAGFVVGTTPFVKTGPFVSTNLSNQQAGISFTPTQTTTTGVGTGLRINVSNINTIYNVKPATFAAAGSGYAVGDTVTFEYAELGGSSTANNLVVKIVSVSGGGSVTSISYVSGKGAETYNIQLSNWVEFTLTPSLGAPVAAPAANTNWFYSVVDQVDIMVRTNVPNTDNPNGIQSYWTGYGNSNYDQNGFPTTGSNITDPNGPICSATAPTTQSDGVTALAYGDLWVNTLDLVNYPIISRWQSVNNVDQWVVIDNADRVNSQGILFADARWATNGSTSPIDAPIPTIADLLMSDYIDLDAPDSNQFPVGTLLFNTRRSGYNVKQYRPNYFNNNRFPDSTIPEYTDTWLSVSGADATTGVPYFGAAAQRNMVVEAMRATVATNQAIRDEDNFFNLIAAPNYCELQPDMVTLNDDRGETAFIVGDTPMTLPANATAIAAWANNAAGAAATGVTGCVTRNTYMGLFYPSGITDDLQGNLVAVPPSYMMLRTFLRNDQIAYPWLAAAGTRRGIIDNATNIGYIDVTTGDFVTTKTSQGIRDVLYTHNINPLVFFTGNGLLSFGNISSYASQSALDRINVDRLICYLRYNLEKAARPFIFEPNDALTRSQIAGVVQTLLVDLVAKRGIYDYLVVCDNSNNTPATIDRNELWVDVAIEPVKAVEFIYIPVRILATGTLGGQGGGN